MKVKLKESILSLVELIYTPDQVGVEKKYIALIEEFIECLGDSNLQIDVIKFQEGIIQLQEAFSIKDYIRMSDILLYEILPVVC